MAAKITSLSIIKFKVESVLRDSLSLGILTPLEVKIEELDTTADAITVKGTYNALGEEGTFEIIFNQDLSIRKMKVKSK